MGRSSPFLSRKSNKQEKKGKYQSTELKWSRFNFKWSTYSRRWGGCDRENHYNYNSMMPPEKGGEGWRWWGKTRWHRPASIVQRHYTSAIWPPPPLSLSKSPFPPLKSVFSLISLIWEKQPDSLPQSPGWASGLVSFPKPLSRSFLWSLIFGKPSSLHS